MIKGSQLMRDINRLEKVLINLQSNLEIKLWKYRSNSINENNNILFWLQYKETLERELAKQSIKTTMEQNESQKQNKSIKTSFKQTQTKQQNVSHKTTKHIHKAKITQSRRQRLWKKFKRDPYTFFADSSNPWLRIISKSIPQRSNNDSKKS